MRRCLIRIINTPEEMHRFSDSVRAEGKTIAFVPTMGFLHKGHASLLELGRKKADVLVLSIFVNPSQFGPNEDLDAYPRNLDGDLAIAEKEGVNTVFAPTPSSMYPKGFQTYINLETLPDHLCGLSRPGHFRGVATVVAKLFNIVKPHYAFFGQKDFQQLAVIKRMVADLDFNIEIIGAPIVRESDGLAMSSRNTYLSPSERHSALCLSRAIKKAHDILGSGIRKSAEIIKAAEDIIMKESESNTGISIDYLAIVDPDTFDNMPEINKQALFALAVKIGKTRLIDNTILASAGS